MILNEIGALIKKYRLASGLSQSELAAIASITRATLIALEKGQLKELDATKLSTLMDIFGRGLFYSQKGAVLDDEVNIRKAIISCNVSYRSQISPELLEDAVSEGRIPKGYEGNMLHFIDEVAVQTILGTIRAVAAKKHKKPKEVWGKTVELARFIKSPRGLWNIR